MASYRKFRLKVPVQGTDLFAVGIGMDANGNKIVRFQPRYGDQRGFSIQTNGNIPTLHNNLHTDGSGWTFTTPAQARQASKEIYDYINQYGTKRQTIMALNRESGGRLRYPQRAVHGGLPTHLRYDATMFERRGWQPQPKDDFMGCYPRRA